jgi:hypothetical protein
MAVSPTGTNNSNGHYGATVTGTVAAVNPKGVRLDGHADWFNFSKLAADIIPPARGQLVTLTLDRQGFVRAVQATDGLESAPRPARLRGPGAARLGRRTAPSPAWPCSRPPPNSAHPGPS